MKKTLRRILGRALAVAMLLVPICAFGYRFLDDDLNYSFVSGSSDEVYVAGLKDESATSIKIPSKVTYEYTDYNDKDEDGNYKIKRRSCTVTSIGAWAFKDCSGLTGSLTIPDGVTSIGNLAFSGCSGLTGRLTIPDSMTSIGWGAFRGCTGLTGELRIPNSVTNIGYDAFRGCSGLTGELRIHNSVMNIKHGTFLGCSGLTSVTIPDSVMSIEDSAFSGCSGLTGRLTIPDSVTSIGDWAFDACSGLTGVCIKNLAKWCNISFGEGNSNPLIYAHNLYLNGALVVNLTIPDSVMSIEGRAFAGCSGLASVTIPTNVTGIGNYAFWGCSGLTNLTVPDNVINVGDYSFGDCSNLTSATLPQSFCVTNVKMKSVFGSGRFHSDSFLKKVSLSANVTNIAAHSFSRMSELDEVYIPNSVTNIGDSAFYGCKLSKVVIGNGVRTIGKVAFSFCTKLAEVSIPDNVINIGGGAFEHCANLQNVIIGTGIKRLGEINAYYVHDRQRNLVGDGEIFAYCTRLRSVSLPDDLSVIGDDVFRGCSSLYDINIPDSLTIIGELAFAGCGQLPAMMLPNSVVSIGENAFQGCGSLKRVAIPQCVFTNSNYQMSDLFPASYSTITSAIIPDGITRIGDKMFYDCIGLTSVTIPNGVTSVGADAFCNCTNLTSVTIPDSVTCIGSHAFRCCFGLTNVVLPNNSAFINWECAFENCGGLQKVVIPDNVKNIDNGAFCNCRLLTDIKIGNSVTNIGSGAFYGCKSLSNLEIPDGVRNIGGGRYTESFGGRTWYYFGAFANCSSLESVTIPNSVTSIEDAAFYGSGLTNVVFEGNAPVVETKAFTGVSSDCTAYVHRGSTGWGVDIPGTWNGIRIAYIEGVPEGTPILTIKDGTLTSVDLNGTTAVVIPDNVTRIGDYAFCDCSGLTSMTIPDSVVSIGEGAFSYCGGLTSMTIPDSVVSIGKYAFYDCGGLTSVDIGDGVTRIGDYAFYDCGGLTSVDIGNGVTSIGKYVFCNCTNLTSVIIPDSVTSIGDYAFRYCEGLTSVTIGSGVTNIGFSAFHCGGVTSVHISDLAAWCRISFANYDANPLVVLPTYGADSCKLFYLDGTLITDLTIPVGVTRIGDYAFEYCNGLTSVTIPDSVTRIGDSSFYYCTNLTSMIIPDSVTNIGEKAFYHCDNLTSVTIPGGVASIGDNAFEYCGGLTNVTIGNGVESIGYSMFWGCSGLTSMTIPDSVTSIGGYAFYGCSGFTSVTIPNSVTNIGLYAFDGCSGLMSVTIPDSVTSIGENTFYWCRGLTSVIFEGNAPSVGRSAFSSTASECTAYVHRGSTGWGVDIPGTWNGIKIAYIGEGPAPDLTPTPDPDPTPYGTPIFTIEDGVLTAVELNGATEVTIPDEVTGISAGVFCYLDDLTTVSIPSGVTNIHRYAFIDCGGLMSFSVAERNLGYKSVGGLLLTKDGQMLVHGINGNVAIPSGVTCIGDSAFAGCRLTGVTMPESVKRIEGYAFSYCYDLTNVTIGSGVTSIGMAAFMDCGLESVTIDNSVTSIGDYAFSGCSGLTSVTIPDSVTSIGANAFSGCSGLADANGFVIVRNILFGYEGIGGLVTIPEGVTRIDEAFADCCDLTGVMIPNSVTNIGACAFWLCEDLTDVFFANPETKFDGSAFHGCVALKSITAEKTGHAPVGWNLTRYENPVELVVESPWEYTFVEIEAKVVPMGTVVRIDDITPLIHGVATDEMQTNTVWFDDEKVEVVSVVTNVLNGVWASFAWAANQYTLAFDSDGGSAVAPITQDYGTAVVVPAAPEKTGYTFTGWTPELPATVPASNATYTAQWQVNQYTVTFNANGGTGGMTRTVTHGAVVGDLPVPMRNGYELVGWFTAAEGGVAVTASIVVTGNVTYYAQWVVHGGEVTDVEFTKTQTVDGVLNNADGAFVGTVQLKVGKINKKKGTVSISATATLLDGKKLAGKAVTVKLNDDGTASGTVKFKAPIGDMHFEMSADGTFTFDNSGYSMTEGAVGGNLSNGTMTFMVDIDSVPALPTGYDLLEDALPFEMIGKVSGGKKIDFGKAASVKYAKVKEGKETWYELDGLDDEKKPNLSSLKLTYTPKTGVFKGSFKIYATNGRNVAPGKKPTLKTYTVNVTGFIVDGEGIGQAMLKKPAASWAVALELE